MSTVIPNEAGDIEGASSNRAAPNQVLKSTYDHVLTALEGNKIIVLITGDAKKGKTALLHAISNNIASSKRTINLSGKDLPSIDKSKSNVVTPELNNMKDFILESTDLDDTLVVILDDADRLPISFISEMVVGIKKAIANGHGMQLILSAPLNYKEQLLNLDQLSEEDIAHCALDSISEEEIHTYAKNKIYKISSDIKRLKFKPASLKALADFIQADQQVLDVVLEWCAALAKKDQLTSITPHTVYRATSFAQQFSKDKNLRLVNSYPPSHEVYKYINDTQSAKKSLASEKKRSVKKPIKNKANKAFIKTNHKKDNTATKIPTITTKVEKNKLAAPITKPAAKQDKEILPNPKVIEDEVMPALWTKSSRQQKTRQSKSFPAMAGLLSLVVIGFIAFIAYRIGNDPKVAPLNETTPHEQIAQQDLKIEVQENVATPATKPSQEVSAEGKSVEIKKIASPTTEKIKQIVTKDENEQTLTTPHAGIIASDSKRDTALDTQTKDNPRPSAGPSAGPSTGLEVATGKTKAANNGQEKNPAQEQQANAQIPSKETSKDTTKKITSSTAEINGFLALAEHQFENKQLTTPPGDNALETYQKILSKQPENKSAIAGIEKLHATYVRWANHYLRRNEVDRAKSFYNKALSIDPSDAHSKTNLQNIAKQEAARAAAIAASKSIDSESSIPSKEIQALLSTAEQKMQQINNDIGENKRNYKIYQEAQVAYQDVLKVQPQNQQARQGLSSLKNFYADWAELQIKSQNYNIALFLYGQALSIEPGNVQINQRVEQIRQLKSAAL